MTMSSPPDTVAVEQLTEQERALYRRLAGAQLSPEAREVTGKLLRLHDTLRARVAELERLLRDAQEPTRDYGELQARVLHLDHIPGLEERKALRDLLAPHDLVQNDPAKMPRLLPAGGAVRAVADQSGSNLPPSMQGCTIEFIECPVGHGRLTATNWADNGCHFCRIAELEQRLEDEQEQTRAHVQAQMLAEARVKELELARPPSCCVSGHHSFSWRQGLEACRYCGEPVRPPG